MNPQDPLAALHPLRQPEAIGWWPVAPGWWILITLVVAALGVLAWYLISRYRANAYRREALSQLETLHKNHLPDDGVQVFAQHTNSLLKSVALRVFPRRDVAALSGEEWRTFLNDSAGGTVLFEEQVFDSLYQNAPAATDTAALHRAAEQWIRKHRRPA